MTILPEHFIFRFEFSPPPLSTIPEPLTAEALSSEFSVPVYERYRPGGTLHGGDAPMSGDRGGEEEPKFDFRIALHERGVLFTILFGGKKRPLFCDPTKLDTSDAFRFLLDTRDVRDVHRATKYCHRFVFLPTDSTTRGGGHPSAAWLPIHRAKAHPNPVDVTRFRLAASVKKEGFAFSAFLPADTLTGYDPKEHSRLGFWFSLFDAELGRFNLQNPSSFPVEEDPSLWSVLAYRRADGNSTDST